MTDDWRRCLQDLSAVLERQRTALQEGRYADIEPFVPPTALAPLPVELADAARVLMRESDALRDSLAATAVAHVRKLRVVSGFTSQAGGAASAYVDTRG